MTNTRWEDTGFDCHLCGGPIFKQTEEDAGRGYYQCQQCEAKWSLDQRQLEPGQAEKQYKRPTAANGGWPWWAWLLTGLTLMFLLTRAGGLGILLFRYAVPVVFVLIVIWVLYRALRDVAE
jgi:hypothetical protein